MKTTETYKPYRILPFRTGNKVVRKYEEHFDDGCGHTAMITKVDYTDKKGKLVEGFILYINWNST